MLRTPVRPLLLLSALLLAGPVVQGCQAPPVEEATEAPPTRRAVNSQMPDRPYSQAVEAGDLVFFSGKVGATDETRAMAEGRTGAEVRNIMDSFEALLGEMGLGFEDVVMATVFLADIGSYGELNEAYGSYFTADPPARETVAVRDIVGGAAVEISFVAVRSR